MLRRFRIVVLLLILVFLSLGTVLDRYYTARWNIPLAVAVFPINADGSSISAKYIASFRAADLAPLERFFQNEAREYGLVLESPIRITLAPILNAVPPLPPDESPNALSIAMWSLHLRWWSWRTPPKPAGPTPRVRLFLLFYDPATHPVLDHSTGLEKGKLGIVKLFSSANASATNLVIIAHELLHTVGATDKYDPSSTLPNYPDGYADPEATPRFPQRAAELMAGRVPLSPTEAKIPDSLASVLIGSKTAHEIGWLK
jgi:hypothetical protein